MALAAAPERVTYAPLGASRAVLECRDAEVLCEGPVGTGKTYGLLWKAHLAALKYPGMRALLFRKTQRSLTESAVQTYTQKILTTGAYGVRAFSGNIEEPRAFRYPNGSRFVVGGMDNADKIMSAEYDMALGFEATELTLTDWEKVTTRLRNGRMPYQQALADCNPDTPTHWLNQRANAGTIRRFLSRHRDNPMLWDSEREDWTPEGVAYMARINKLTGVRRKRLLDGIWAAAEGQVYEGWDPALHIVDRFDIPASWRRYWVIDFGYTNPFVWQWWAEDPDGTLWCYREIYMTGRLVEDHAALGMALSAGEPRPSAIISDHDAEDRATLERKTGYRTIAAKKSVSDGIQAVAERLRSSTPRGPRLRYLRDSLVERDATLAEAGAPTSTVEEYGSYVWDLAAKRRKGEEPVKKHDHGMDATRYMVAHVDLRQYMRFV